LLRIFFYFVKIILPFGRKRSEAINAIEKDLAVIIYRVVSLIYLHQVYSKKNLELNLKKYTKIISYDLNTKKEIIDDFREYLAMPEIQAIGKEAAYRDKFLMEHHKLDDICQELTQSIIQIIDSLGLPEFANGDKEWLKIENNKVEFDEKCDTYKFFLVELYERVPVEVNQLPEFLWLVEGQKSI
jgi:hypothetical protein